jgi:hypothetical protein
MVDEGQRLDGLFPIALMLVSIMAVAEFQYVVAKDISEIKYYFWILTYPIAVLIFAWLMKELVQRKNHRVFHMILTEFCWYLWIAITYYLLNQLYVLLIGSDAASWLLMLIPFGLLIFYIRNGYRRAYPWMHYFDSWTYSIEILVIAILVMVFYTLFFHSI